MVLLFVMFAREYCRFIHVFCICEFVVLVCLVRYLLTYPIIVIMRWNLCGRCRIYTIQKRHLICKLHVFMAVTELSTEAQLQLKELRLFYSADFNAKSE